MAFVVAAFVICFLLFWGYLFFVRPYKMEKQIRMMRALNALQVQRDAVDFAALARQQRISKGLTRCGYGKRQECVSRGLSGYGERQDIIIPYGVIKPEFTFPEQLGD